MSAGAVAPYAQLVPLYEKQKQSGEAQWARGMEALLKGKIKDADGALARISPPTADSLRGQAMVADAWAFTRATA